MAKSGSGDPAPRVKQLSDRERLFVHGYCRARGADRAAKAYRDAGYKCTTDADAQAKATNLMSPHVNPRVAAAIAEELGRLNGEPVLNGRAVLGYVHAVMTFSPLDWFEPGGDGGWTITPERLRGLPREVKMLIEEVECRTVPLGDDQYATVVWCRFVGKTEAMKLAAKYQLPSLVFGPDGLPPGGTESGAGGTGSSAQQGVDWDRLMGVGRRVLPGAAPTGVEDEDDPVERKILALEGPKEDDATP